MGNPGDCDERHFAIPGDSDMALLTLENSDVEFCNKSRYGQWERQRILTLVRILPQNLFCVRFPIFCPSSPNWGIKLTDVLDSGLNEVELLK